MSDPQQECLEVFPEWLKNLGSDATDLAEAVGDDQAPVAVRRYAAAGLNYLFKSLDLIPDGIEDLGYLDDAFVIRVAAKLAVGESEDAAEKAPKVVRLAKDTRLIQDLLGDDFSRLEEYVKRLRGGAARGRTVDEILADDSVQQDFLNEVRGWATSYECPNFARDEKTLVKLKSFLSAKLP
jgi:uncharacterized membrane protein YkvA (DUF1232 family)